MGWRDDFMAFADCLCGLASEKARLRCVAGRVIYEPEPTPELAALLKPYEPAMASILERAGGSVTWGPLTPGQEALWYLQAAQPRSLDYNTVAAFKLALPIDHAALEHAFNEIARYVPVIRASFPAIEGMPVQQIREQLPVHVIHEDGTGWDDARLEARMSEIFNRPYDLERTGLFQIYSFTLAPSAHAIMICAHHIIGDFWSLTLLIQHLCRVYATARAGEWITLPPPSFPYPEYVLAQRDMLDGPRGAELRAFWEEQLRDVPSGLDLPADRPRRPRERSHGAMRHFTLDPKLTAGVLQTARALRTTPYTVLLCALQTLFHRLTGQTDILTGTPMHGRRDRRTRDSIGYFSNMTVLRNRLHTDETFSGMVERMHGVVNAAIRRHDYPFPLVTGLAPTRRDPSRPVLIETSFTYFQSGDAAAAIAAFPMDRPGVHLTLSDLPLESLSVCPRFSPLDISLLAAQLDETIAYVWQYDTDLFDAETIDMYTARLRTLLASIVENPDQPLSALNLVSPEERQALASWNATTVEYDLTRGVVERISEIAQSAPEAIAVTDAQGETLTYRELERLSRDIAARLVRWELSRGSIVGVHLRRTSRLAPVLLGILRAGAAYLALDPEYPAARLAFMLADSGARALISDAAATFPGAPESCRIVALEELLAPSEAEPGLVPGSIPQAAVEAVESSPGTSVLPEDPAYILYTSGSTGAPKGVIIPHRALTNFLLAMRSDLKLSQQDRLLALTSISFDIAGLELYLPLICGAQLRVATREETTDAFRLAQIIRDYAPSIMQATPATWAMLIEAGWTGDPALTALCGGEALSRELADSLLPRCRALWNMYGPTETTIWSAMRLVTPDTGPVSVGLPIANTTFFVLDENGVETPIGVPGQLAIGGVGVALGYHNRPELTAERFVEHAGERVYLTGDQVRRRHDGTLLFLGRLDGQIKLHGHRIELGEIEAAMEAQPEIARAAARLFGPEYPHRLVGYFTAHAGARIDPATLRERLVAQLPLYMVPSALVALDELPLTPNRKVDRSALPAPQVQADAEDAALLTPVEARLAALWSELLHTPITRPDTDFFSHGGHSLLLVTMLSRVQREFGVSVALGAFLREPTIARLARLLEGHAEAREDLLVVDSRMSLSVRPRDVEPGRISHPPQAILLTGGAGFLGIHLLRELLQRTDADIWLLLRNTSGLAALERGLRAYRLWDPSLRISERVHPVFGNLAQDDCGLSAEAWRQLAERIDTIIHCGAQVNFIYPYEALRATNVLSTQALLRLAFEGREKAFHLVSTFSVFDAPECAYRGDPIREDDFFANGSNIIHAYGQSKWCAETLTRRARELGALASIYRPGRISGQSATGLSNPTDLLDRVLLGCIEIGAVPDFPMSLDMTPVDYVAAAIATLALNATQSATYHLVNQRPATAREVVAYLRDRGYRLEALTYDAWRDRIHETQNERLAPLLPLFTDELPIVLGGAPEFDTAHVERDLTGSGIVCPPADAALLRVYVDALMASGSWPEPAIASRRGPGGGY
jgi:myxalamid-type nonribosomal peptide synthetase MxaA